MAILNYTTQIPTEKTIAEIEKMLAEMVKIEEIFLPYMYNQHTGETMFQMLEKKGFDFQIEDKSEQSTYKEVRN